MPTQRRGFFLPGLGGEGWCELVAAQLLKTTIDLAADGMGPAIVRVYTCLALKQPGLGRGPSCGARGTMAPRTPTSVPGLGTQRRYELVTDPVDDERREPDLDQVSMHKRTGL